MRQRYGRRKIDFIITLYPESLKFLLDQGKATFTDAPIRALYLPQGFEPLVFYSMKIHSWRKKNTHLTVLTRNTGMINLDELNAEWLPAERL